MSKKIKKTKTTKKNKIDDNFFYEEDDSRHMKDKILIKRLFRYMKDYKVEFIFIILSVLISSALMTLLPLCLKKILDLLEVDGTTFKEVMKYGYYVIGCIIVAFSIGYVRGIVLNKVGQRILYSLRGQLFSHIENLSLRELDKIPVGTFVTRVTNDTNALSDLFTSVIVSLIGEVMTLVYSLIFMFILSVKLALIVVCIAPVLVLATAIFRYASRKQFRRITYNNSILNAFLSENLSGMKITQIFNRENAKMVEFDEKSERLKRSHAGSVIIFSIFRPFIFLLYFSAVILIFYFGGKEYMAGITAFTTGTLYSIYMYIGNVFGPIQNIAQQYNTMQQAFASTEKIFTILDMKSSITFKENPVMADDFKGEIEFKDVWFRYDKDWIIKGISFHVSPGETIALVGPTGAGKTTILSLLMRYYDIEKGEILVDGVNIKDYDIRSLRRNVGEMLQDVFLFTGTIKDNITLREESLSDEDVISASKYVNADSFIKELPLGYDEPVKERGNNYSQGQRQLLSFARTIVHKPKMIILDEATSNIDTETEVLIQDSLEKIKTIGTTLIVAHRLSTIQHSDKIMFIDDGKVIEEGNHQELLKLKGRYYNLYELQYDKE